MMFKDYFQDEFNHGFYSFLAENTNVEWLKADNNKGYIDVAEITLPLFDHNGDNYRFYVEDNGDEFIITDNGYFLNYLSSKGITTKTDPDTWKNIDDIISNHQCNRDVFSISKKVVYKEIASAVYDLLIIVRKIEDIIITK